MQFIHRDIAARNVLLCSQGQAKIGDFGMSRLLNGDKDYYRADDQAMLPTRWMSAESIDRYKFTLKSDVWSLGIVMFEVFSHGETPYGELSNMVCNLYRFILFFFRLCS